MRKSIISVWVVFQLLTSAFIIISGHQNIVAANTLSPDYNQDYQLFKIPVHIGWNQISLPCIPRTEILPDALLDATSMTLWDRVMWYDPIDSDHWKQYNANWDSGMNDLTSVNYSMGILINIIATDSGYLTLAGNMISEDTTLYFYNTSFSNSNLIGYPAVSDTVRTVKEMKIATNNSILSIQNENITLPDNFILKRGDGYWISVNKNFTFTINNKIPCSKITNVNSYWMKQNSTLFNILISNASANYTELWYRYSSDNSSWGEWYKQNSTSVTSIQFYYSEGKGYYQFYTLAGNNATGNYEGALGIVKPIVKYAYDNVYPMTQSTIIGDIGNNSWYTSTVNIILSASDNMSGIKDTWYKIDSGSLIKYAGIIPEIKDGWHNIIYNSTDKAGNQEPINTLIIKIDTTAPITTSIITGAPGERNWFKSRVNVTLNAVGGISPLLKTLYRVDRGQWQNYTNKILISDNGTHIIEYYSVDMAGNVEMINSAAVNIDDDSPKTLATVTGNIGNSGWYTSDVNVSISAMDSTSGIQSIWYKINTNPVSSQYYKPFTITNEGVTIISFNSSDKAGNNEKTNWINITINKQTPITTARLSNGIGINGWNGSAVVVNLSAVSGPSGLLYTRYRWNAGPWNIYKQPIVIGLNGTHVIEYYSVDNAGNIEIVNSLSFKIDGAKPQLDTIANGLYGDNGWFKSTVNVMLSATDNISGVSKTTYSINGDPSVDYTGPFMISKEGNSTIFISTTDVAGNYETKWVNLSIDTTRPNTIATISNTIGNNGWYTSSATIKLSANYGISGPGAIYYRQDNGQWKNSLSISVSGDGSHTIEYYSIDKAGNIESINSIELKIDDDKPMIIPQLATPIVSASPFMIYYNALDNTSGIDYIEVTCDNYTGNVKYSRTFITKSNPISLNLQGNVYTIILTPVDKAGNKGIPYPAFNVTIDDGLRPSTFNQLTDTSNNMHDDIVNNREETTKGFNQGIGLLGLLIFIALLLTVIVFVYVIRSMRIMNERIIHVSQKTGPENNQQQQSNARIPPPPSIGTQDDDVETNDIWVG